jgi:hypothetical protein
MLAAGRRLPRTPKATVGRSGTEKAPRGRRPGRRRWRAAGVVPSDGMERVTQHQHNRRHIGGHLGMPAGLNHKLRPHYFAPAGRRRLGKRRSAQRPPHDC